MATRPQERATVPANVKNGKPQQEIVDNASLRRLYAVALQCRSAGERGAAGGGAVVAHAAATVELTSEDFVAAARESFALDLVRGGSVAANTRSGSPARGNGGPAKVIAREAAGSSYLSIAAGVAFALKQAGKQAIVVALADSDVIATGASYEALHYASAHKLPLVAVVDNMGTPGNVARPDFLTVAQAHGVPAFLVDGEDAVAVYRVGREAIHRARSGRGPSLIECRAFATNEDPLRHLERYLQKHGLWTPQWKREIIADADGNRRGVSSSRSAV